MGFYVDLDTDEMADELWASHPARGRNIPPVGNKNCNIGAAVEGAADVAEVATTIRETGCGRVAEGT